ncbi:MAG: hypothetical protein HFG37_10050 [Eubacterium sp.]|nr:hypothetical protein [Eubacterium sp.]
MSYELSEQLFLDVWNKFGSPTEILDKPQMNKFLTELVNISKGWIILDHYSNINFDNIKKIESDEKYTKIFWKDFNNLRKKYLSKTISEDEFMTWQIFGYYTYHYVLMDISKLKFLKIHTHLFVLLQANIIKPKEIEKYLLTGNELISKEINTDELYTEYVFLEGKSEDIIKHSCIFGNLPYYSVIIQPKENCTASSVISKQIMLFETLNDIQNRLQNAQNNITKTPAYDFDELFSKGNTIRRILEFALKHYCVWANIPIEIEDKYGYIELGKLKKILGKSNIEIPQTLINIANELSHDSGTQFTKDDILKFYNNVYDLISTINQAISQNPHHIEL